MDVQLRLVSPIQYLFLGTAVLFLACMALSMSLRSQGRKSIIGGISSAREDSLLFADLADATESGSKLQLQDFHRVELKEGRPVWDIKAKDARYFASDSLMHVNDASVVIHRSNRSSVRIETKAAKLHTNGQALAKAELEGQVKVRVDKSLTIETEFADYVEESREITTPGHVEIHGDGFEVGGLGLRLDIDSQVVELTGKVTSRFEPNAEIPKGPSMQGLLK